MIKPIPRKRKQLPVIQTNPPKKTRKNKKTENVLGEYYTTSLQARLNTLPAHLIASLGRLRIVNGASAFNAETGRTIAARLPNLATVTFFTSHGGLLPLGFDKFMSHLSAQTMGSLVVRMTRPVRFRTTDANIEAWMEIIQDVHLGEGWEVRRDVEAELTGGTTLMVCRKV
ncbi:uncharacterized protein BDZ99DRAFT_456701 [Mytilinidion resinicola]|uniref:Uncharacterized protein n=1 Tax=Mytilinidion resinicola TaxID=574789 RepID=A0A6A6Z7W8_9PEZI|nr:uncharacterized protein BDZ99DRAFT_456701 [Mytilinidion resinicola]KAF2816898.1 hypothetical protein BDZ99DRAFT_456701 [Mytilinidion resinicola]